MNKALKAVMIAAAAAGIAGCTGEPDQPLELNLEQSTFVFKPWNPDGSHLSTVKGKLLMGDAPVANAVLHVGENNRSISTGEDGSFEILLDQSLLGQKSLRVESLENAAVNGKPIETAAMQNPAVSAALQVQYPIVVHSAEVSREDPGQMVVQGQIMADESVNYFKLDKFRIAGTVKDASGRPVQGAVVWIDRDGGEGFAKSTPTDAQGRYEMFYVPEDEDTYLSVTTNGGRVKYTLPPDKVYHFPEETSIEIDIVLPQEGTVIEDRPPTLVSRTASGGLYLGILAGLEAPRDVAYTITIPDAGGRFTITVPKEIWDEQPAFFETSMTKFVEEELKPGDTVPASFIEPEPNAARGIRAELKAAS